MDRALARDHAARRDGGAVAVDRRFRRLGDTRIAVEREIVIGGEIGDPLATDDRLGAGDAVMDTEERIGMPSLSAAASI
jgi:hypothetical protein